MAEKTGSEKEGEGEEEKRGKKKKGITRTRPSTRRDLGASLQSYVLHLEPTGFRKPTRPQAKELFNKQWLFSTEASLAVQNGSTLV